MQYVVAASRPGYAPVVEALQKQSGADFTLVESRRALTLEALNEIKPRYVFLPDWSYKISAEIYETYECVIFHMTDLPFGRGGSPLQNLISRRIYETQLSALRCVEELDAGPIYLKRPLSLHDRAEEIYQRMAVLVQEMILTMIQTEPEPQAQQGEVVHFSRRRPEESNLLGLTDLNQIYDHIRMLDAEGYPHAFVDVHGFRLEFTRASFKPGEVIAEVRIRERKGHR